jgi:hypothetical protein
MIVLAEVPGLLTAFGMMTGTANLHYMKLGNALTVIAAVFTALRRRTATSITGALGIFFLVCHFNSPPFKFHQVCFQNNYTSINQLS